MNKNILYLFTACFFVFIVENTFCQSWNFLQKSVAPDRRNGFELLGNSLDMNGDYAMVGAWANDFDENGRNYLDDAGAVYLYQKTAEGVWPLIKKIVASDRTIYDGFGSAVAIDSNYAVIGAPFEGSGLLESAGAIYVFENRDGDLTEVKKLFAPDRDYLDEFGSQVAISGDWILVGVPRESEDENGQNTILGAGSAYLYHRNGGEWAFTQKIVASDRVDGNDRFGGGVAISGDYAAITAIGNKNSGAVYIFKNGGGYGRKYKN